MAIWSIQSIAAILFSVFITFFTLQRIWIDSQKSCMEVQQRPTPMVLEEAVDVSDNMDYFRRVACRNDKSKLSKIKPLLARAPASLTPAEVYSMLLFPMYSVCKYKITIGGTIRGTPGSKIIYDGQKMICLDKLAYKDTCLIYSFGIGGEVTFEKAMAKYGCQVIGYDHTINVENSRRLEDREHNFIIKNQGIGTQVNPAKKLTTLENELKIHGHLNRTIDAIKIDVEGAEVWVFKDWFAKGLLSNVEQIMVEFHGMSTQDKGILIKGLYNAGFLLVGYETNWFGSVRQERPEAYELHFMKGILNC